MKLLTDTQRRKYELLGSLNVDMSQERKTFFHYKVLTPKIKKEFQDILEFAFSDKAKKLRYYDKTYSSDRHFIFQNNCIRIVTEFRGHRFQDDSTSSGITIVRIYDSEICILAATKGKPYRKLLTITHRYFLDKLGFDDKFNGNIDDPNHYCYNYNLDFYKKRIINSPLRESLESSLSDGVSLPYYCMPDLPYDLSTNPMEKGMITYKNRDRIVKMKVGKGLKKFLKIHGQILSDEDVKNVSARLSTDIGDFTLKVVEGSDIDTYYHVDKYDNCFDTGSLGSSCMRGDDAIDGDFFEVYKENAKMIILINEASDLIIGRAILWDDVTYIGSDNTDEGLKNGQGVKVMDRIYSNESVYHIFKDWALANGYYRKRYQSYNNEKLWRSPSTEQEVELDFEIAICLNDYGNSPYMDTFAWGDSDSVRNNDCFGHYTARSTEGILEGGDNDRSDDWDDEDGY
tara:strand:- start:324 stop:1694 length:1371 start_codon:yes stop_codon:yes gene_type:complete